MLSGHNSFWRTEGRLRRLAIGLLFFAVFGGHDLAHGETAAQTVRAVLAAPEDAVDYARAKLALDKIVDPATDVEAVLHQVDSMVADIRLMTPPNAPDIEKLREVRRYIYVSGSWNEEAALQL